MHMQSLNIRLQFAEFPLSLVHPPLVHPIPSCFPSAAIIIDSRLDSKVYSKEATMKKRMEEYIQVFKDWLTYES